MAMLTAQKVKQHGMTSSKWSTQDKITQYKGLINLYTRDKKILEIDNAIKKKRQAKEMKILQNDIDIGRKKLENAIGGDKQKLRNTLAVHRELQLTFQNSSPQKAIDAVHQVNFTKRKTRDILKYKMKLKSDRLVDLKLKCSLNEDTIKFSVLQPMLDCEKKAHVITAKVQDAILRKEAAISIRNCYKEMIAIMKKDTIYFNALIDSLRSDGFTQAKCMITATTLGQIGMEYLDDRRREFIFLERIVKGDMQSRKKDLASVQQRVSDFVQNLRSLVRRESDINFGKVEIKDTDSVILIQKEVATIESSMKILKRAFSATSTDQIYPCLRDQLQQKERLVDLRQKSEINNKDMLKKTRNATLQYYHLKTSMIETTNSYNTKKEELRDKIQETLSLKIKNEQLVEERHALLAKVRISLKHLQYLSTLLTSSQPELKVKRHSSSIKLVPPEDDECNYDKIIPDLVDRFSKLISNSKDIIDQKADEPNYRLFETLMRDRSKPVAVDTKASEGSLIETVFVDTRVPTHDDIKNIGDEIVAQNLAALEIKPIPPPKKKFKFKK